MARDDLPTGMVAAVRDPAMPSGLELGLDPVLAAGLPTAGAAALALVDWLTPLSAQTVLIAGAGGCIGSFATQFAANVAGRVIASGARTQRNASLGSS